LISWMICSLQASCAVQRSDPENTCEQKVTPEAEAIEIDTNEGLAAISSTSCSRETADSKIDWQQSHFQPDFSFGLIADVQWADIEDGHNFAKTSIRHYRGAFQNLVEAVDWWSEINKIDNEQPSNGSGDNGTDDDEKKENGTVEFTRTCPLSFVAQLGDLLDGINADLGQSKEAFSKALDQLDRMGPKICPSINLVGNHELYNFDRVELAQALWLKHGNKEYYSFSPSEGWKVVVLDAYQISLIGHTQDDLRLQEAVELIAEKNPNVSPDGASGSNWFDGIPQNSYRRRFVPFNGGYGCEQLEWLQAELEAASSKHERVILLSHVPIHPKALSRAVGGSSFVWDYDQVLEILHSVQTTDGNSIVAAILCGHDHQGGYHLDDCGIHHVTVASPLNQGSKGSAFGVVRVFRDGMELVGPCIDDLMPKKGGQLLKQSFVGSLGSSNRLLESIYLPFGSKLNREREHHLKKSS